MWRYLHIYLPTCSYINFIFSSALWLIYGHAKGLSKLVQANIVGLFLMCGYTTVFYFYTLKKDVVLNQSAAIFVVFTLVMFNLNATRFSEHLGRHKNSTFSFRTRTHFIVIDIHLRVRARRARSTHIARVQFMRLCRRACRCGALIAREHCTTWCSCGVRKPFANRQIYGPFARSGTDHPYKCTLKTELMWRNCRKI